MQAGIALRGAEFLVLSLGLSVAGGLLVAMLAKGRILSGIVSGIAIYACCLAYLNIKIARRLKAFNNQLPDVLDMMANALRSGFSFFQTVEMVSRETTPPVSQEFARMIREMSLGVTTEEALGNLITRVKSDDLGLVVTAVLVQRQVGGNLSVILDNISATIRERVAMKGELRSITAQGRLSGWIVGAMPIVMVFVLLAINPDYISPLFSDPLGRLLIASGVISQLIGIVVIRRIVDIDM
jgi:tight adherence protein B